MDGVSGLANANNFLVWQHDGSGTIELATINGINFSIVPEPATYALWGVVLMGFAAVLHRQRRRNSAR